MLFTTRSSDVPTRRVRLQPDVIIDATTSAGTTVRIRSDRVGISSSLSGCHRPAMMTAGRIVEVVPRRSSLKFRAVL
jgi:hypothetical protein